MRFGVVFLSGSDRPISFQFETFHAAGSTKLVKFKFFDRGSFICSGQKKSSVNLHFCQKLGKNISKQ